MRTLYSFIGAICRNKSFVCACPFSWLLCFQCYKCCDSSVLVAFSGIRTVVHLWALIASSTATAVTTVGSAAMALRSARLLRQLATTGSGWRFTPTRHLRRLQPAVDRQPVWKTAEEAVSVIESGLSSSFFTHDLDLGKCCKCLLYVGEFTYLFYQLI